MATKKKKKTVRKVSKKKRTSAKKPRKKVSRKKAAPKKKKSSRATKKVAKRKKPSAKKPAKRKSRAKKKTSPKRKSGTKRKAAARRKTTTRKRQQPSIRAVLAKGSTGGVNYRALEAEILKLSELLQTISKKNKLVRRSLDYLEKEQKKLSKQIQDAKKFLTRLKNRSLQVLREFPDNAEDLYYQLKDEFNRLSHKLGFR